jgi:hypothetical protein
MSPAGDAVLMHLRITGVLMALLVAVNLYVPSHLRWRDEMARLSLVNRQIFQVHSFFIVLILALFSLLLLTCGDALLEPTRLSRAILAGLTIFWAARLAIQVGFYSPAIWTGDRLYRTMHYVFVVTWMYVMTVCAAALWHNMST